MNNPYNQNPYANYFQQPNSTANQTSNEQPYQKQNTKTHFAMGLAAGAAVAYLLSSKKFKQGVTATGEKAFSAVYGEVEELKERLEDTQAELEYYRNLHEGEK